MAEQRNEIRSLACFFNAGNVKVNINSETKLPCMQCNGTSVSGLMSICTYLATTAGKAELVGKDAKSRALVGQWLEYRVTEVDRCHGEKDDINVFKELNSYLSTRTYFVGQQFSLADLLLYYGLHTKVNGLTYEEKEKYLHLSRWFDHVQRLQNTRQHLTEVTFSLNRLYAGYIPH
ncbi:eukaryotic translation elongation factor 1 epsilon-1 [Strongylocentrotus purpuratus]|uniref:GST C-terminal domain-containing protein n=1 Tax=Strongylocentrotus purpuratus TaxID=7668 RepID=A0A7M7RCQ1_STRPU|nr:eukaryotic translation elongation factor 1 epsilon-1 [Strongylocentrotus purpuratus]|eukprot:XP_787842.2 PREDICTED: eukaryotic translation elongation factor 1 epsilon-1 [Strongylocentrotus purpuratus]